MKKMQEKLSKLADLAESEVVKDAMKLIPNHPFPAGTLVKALVNVLVIGVVRSSVVLIVSRNYPNFLLQRIPEVKQQAFDFAMEVVQDITRMAEAFGSATSSNKLLMESWNSDLQEMRYIHVNDWRWNSTFSEPSWMRYVNGHMRLLYEDIFCGF
jgi:hypothetical protein